MSYQYKNKLHGVAILIEETGELFETRTKCAEHLGVSSSAVSLCVSGKTRLCAGYHLRVVDHDLCDVERVRVAETGKLYRSCAECARDIGGTSSGIHDCKTGRQKQHRGYHFEFFEEDV